MALTFNEVKEIFETSQLTPAELKYIDNAEKYIDRELLDTFTGKSGLVDSKYLKFDRLIDRVTGRTEVHAASNPFSASRKTLMYREIHKRYTNAGWWLEEFQTFFQFKQHI